MTTAPADHRAWLAGAGRRGATVAPAPAPTAHTESEPGLRTLLEQIGQQETARLFATWKTETPLFGAREAARTAAVAEDAARNGNPSELPTLDQRLEDQIAQAIADLELQLTA